MQRKPHIGLPEGAPSEVKWSNKSFLKPVEMFEEFNFRPYVLLLSFCWIPLLVLAILMWPKGDEEDKPGFVVICLGLVGVAGLLLHGHLLKYILIRIVRCRQGRLFEPNWKSIFVYIEDSKTFKKLKLLPNDFGLLRAHNGYIDIEMMNYRAHLSIKDVSVLIRSATNRTDAIGVQLASKTEEWPLNVTFVAPLQNWNLLLGANDKKRAKWLLGQIQKGVDSE